MANQVIFSGFKNKDEVFSFVRDMCNGIGYTSLAHPGVIYESNSDDPDDVIAHVDINELEKLNG